MFLSKVTCVVFMMFIQQLIFLTGMVSGIEPEVDACTYIGARLAKTHSVCKDGFCVGIIKTDSPVQIAPAWQVFGSADHVSCPEAKEIVRQIEGDSEGQEERLIPCYMSIYILEGLKPLALTRQPLPFFVQTHMKSLFKLPKNRIRQYLIDTASDLNKYMEIIWKGILADPHTDLLGPALHFWFDLAGLFPDLIPLPSAERLFQVTIQTLSTPVTHRPMLHLESVLTLDGPIISHEQASRIVQSIDRISSSARLGSLRLDPSDWTAIGDILVNRYRGTSSSVAMLLFMIRKKICPSVDHVANMLLTARNTLSIQLAVKNGVSLVRECSESALPGQLRSASIALGHLSAGTDPGRFLELTSRSYIDQIANPSLNWICGFSPNDADNLYAIAATLYHLEGTKLAAVAALGERYTSKMFLTEAQYKGSVEYKEFTRGVGRIIGLGLRANLGLKFMGLHPIIVELLKDPSAIAEAPGMDLDDTPFDFRYGSTLAEMLYAVHLVREGIRETLGPAVFEAYTDTEFQNVFLS